MNISQTKMPCVRQLANRQLHIITVCFQQTWARKFLLFDQYSQPEMTSSRQGRICQIMSSRWSASEFAALSSLPASHSFFVRTSACGACVPSRLSWPQPPTGRCMWPQRRAAAVRRPDIAVIGNSTGLLEAPGTAARLETVPTWPTLRHRCPCRHRSRPTRVSSATAATVPWTSSVSTMPIAFSFRSTTAEPARWSPIDIVRLRQPPSSCYITPDNSAFYRRRRHRHRFHPWRRCHWPTDVTDIDIVIRITTAIISSRGRQLSPSRRWRHGGRQVTAPDSCRSGARIETVRVAALCHFQCFDLGPRTDVDWWWTVGRLSTTRRIRWRAPLATPTIELQRLQLPSPHSAASTVSRNNNNNNNNNNIIITTWSTTSSISNSRRKKTNRRLSINSDRHRFSDHRPPTILVATTVRWGWRIAAETTSPWQRQISPSTTPRCFRTTVSRHSKNDHPWKVATQWLATTWPTSPPWCAPEKADECHQRCRLLLRRHWRTKAVLPDAKPTPSSAAPTASAVRRRHATYRHRFARLPSVESSSSTRRFPVRLTTSAGSSIGPVRTRCVVGSRGIICIDLRLCRRSPTSWQLPATLTCSSSTTTNTMITIVRPTRLPRSGDSNRPRVLAETTRRRARRPGTRPGTGSGPVSAQISLPVSEFLRDARRLRWILDAESHLVELFVTDAAIVCKSSTATHTLMVLVRLLLYSSCVCVFIRSFAVIRWRNAYIAVLHFIHFSNRWMDDGS